MISVLVIDDHRLFRMGIAEMLPESGGFNVVGAAESAEEGVGMARQLRPNVVLMDILMPGIGGLEAIKRIRRMDRHIRVIALSACASDPFPMQALKAGAMGYITKGVSTDELQMAIRRVHMGKRYLAANVARQLAEKAFDAAIESPFELLSGRELQIMLMIINCRKVGDVAQDLHLSPKTVNSYRYRIFEKLRVSNDVELALLAVRHGMTPLDPKSSDDTDPPEPE